MNWLRSIPASRRAGVGLALLASLLYAASILFAAAGPKPADPKPAQKPRKKTEHKLTGAELYAINCNRCHAERYPTEWTSTQWKTLMTHMRVRANLPASQARRILQYLQEDSGQ